jgi:putative component of membrane protein insertase Oxa1/YidC/SpoIIIJ protein YidD
MRFKWLLLILPLTAYATPGFHTPWGKDTDLHYTTPSESPPPAQHSIAVRTFEKVINFHQQVLSPVDGPRSHYRPSSSAYMKQALHKHGFVKGFIMGCDRLMRENSDEWVYRKIEENGKLFKYDPVK